jgi:hypothetical protein
MSTLVKFFKKTLSIDEHLFLTATVQSEQVGPRVPPKQRFHATMDANRDFNTA